MALFNVVLIINGRSTVDGRVVSSEVVRAPRHAHPQYSIDCSSVEHLPEGTRNSP
jgi:hypothetical protein